MNSAKALHSGMQLITAMKNWYVAQMPRGHVQFHLVGWWSTAGERITLLCSPEEEQPGHLASIEVGIWELLVSQDALEVMLFTN